MDEAFWTPGAYRAKPQAAQPISTAHSGMLGECPTGRLSRGDALPSRLFFAAGHWFADEKLSPLDIRLSREARPSPTAASHRRSEGLGVPTVPRVACRGAHRLPAAECHASELSGTTRTDATIPVACGAAFRGR